MINKNRIKQILYLSISTALILLFTSIASPITSPVAASPVTDPSCTGTNEKLTTNSNGSISCNCPAGQNQIVAIDGTQQCAAAANTSGDCVTGQEASCRCPSSPHGQPTVPCTDSAAQVANPNAQSDPTSTCTSSGCDLVLRYVDPTIKLLAAVVGIAAVTSIIVGGIQYSTSAGDPQKAAKAKGRIMNAIIALVAFAFLYGFLQFILPGGAF